MSDDDHTRHSGSRWEPGPAEHDPAEPAAAAGVTPSDTTPPQPDAAEAHAHPADGPQPETHRIPVVPVAAPDWSALPPFSTPPPPRRRRRAVLIAAAAAAGLLGVGGLGGYAIASAAADTGVAAGGPGGAAGGYGHHRGPLGREGGSARDADGDGDGRGGSAAGPGTPANPGGGTAGAPSSGTGTGTTGAST